MRLINIRTAQVTDNVRGLVYFAQCLDELLFDHAHDTYRSPALNTHLRVIELSMVARQLQTTPYFSRTVPPFVDEFEWSVSGDPILSSRSKARLLATTKAIRTQLARPDVVLPMVDGMHLEFREYSPTLRSEIFRTVLTRPHEKERILDLASSFSVEVEVEGYSRRYAYFGVKRLIDRIAHDQNIDPAQLLNRFLRRLPPEPKVKTFVTVLRGNARFEHYAEHAKAFGFQVVNAAPALARLNAEATDWIGAKAHNERLLLFEALEQTDPMNAKKFAEDAVKNFRASVDYVSHEEDLSVLKDAVVVEEPLGGTLIRKAPDPMHCGAKVDDKVQEIVQIVAEVMHGDHLDAISSYRFGNALQYHAAALHASQPENQLVDLWAALEGLILNSDSREARIQQIVNAITPCLLLAYIDELFLAVANEIAQDANANAFVDGLAIAGAPLQRASAFCVCREFEAARTSLGQRIADSNPLLLYRLHALRERFRSRHRIRKTLIGHRKKLEWHLNRIYFTRNSIVHTAESLPYLSMLVQHLHSYVDITVRAIATVAVASRIHTTIGQVTSFLAAHSEHHLVSLNEKDDTDCNLTNFVDLLVGTENPISLFEVV